MGKNLKNKNLNIINYKNTDNKKLLSELIGKPVMEVKEHSNFLGHMEYFRYLLVPFKVSEKRVYAVTAYNDLILSGRIEIKIYDNERKYQDMTGLIQEAREVQDRIGIKIDDGDLDRFEEQYAEIKKYLVKSGFIKN